MKPYRGIHLAAAVLLAALSLAGCGDADKYAESGTITLTSDVSTVEVKSYVVLTVVSVPTTTTPATTPAQAKVILDECAMDLEVRSDGAGANQNWLDVPGTDATRVFRLLPREIGTLNVLSRGKCVGSNEPWEYSAPVKVTVTEEILPMVTGVTVTVTPTTVVGGNPVVFTVSVTKETDCTLRVNTVVNGNTYSNYTNPAWSTTSGFTGTLATFDVTSATSLIIATEAYCTQNDSERVSATVTVAVTP
jgi:hypothetical protein